MANWSEVCAPDDIGQEGVIRFTQGSKIYAVCRSPDDRFYCTDDICTHEHVDATDGLVMDNTSECPRHDGVFDCRTGEAFFAPVGVNLKSHPTKSENGRILIEI